MLKVRDKKTHSFLQSSEISHPISNKNWGALESCNANFGLLRKYLRRFQDSVGVFSNFVGDNFYFVGGSFYFVGGNFCFVGGNFYFVGEKNNEFGQNTAQKRRLLAFTGQNPHIHCIFLQNNNSSLTF